MPKLHTVFSNKNLPATLKGLIPVGRPYDSLWGPRPPGPPIHSRPRAEVPSPPQAPPDQRCRKSNSVTKVSASRVINCSIGTNQHQNATAAWRNGSVWSSYQRGLRLRLWVRVPSWSTVSFCPSLSRSNCIAAIHGGLTSQHWSFWSPFSNGDAWWISAPPRKRCSRPFKLENAPPIGLGCRGELSIGEGLFS
jgi:hypothetical protein